MKAVSDQEVCDSFLASVAGDGFVMQYLQHACLGVCIGNTAFVHGAIGPCGEFQHCGNVPTKDFTYSKRTLDDFAHGEGADSSLGDYRGHRVQQWLLRLNAFAQEELTRYLEGDPLFESPGDPNGVRCRAGQALMAQ